MKEKETARIKNVGVKKILKQRLEIVTGKYSNHNIDDIENNVTPSVFS